MGELIKMLRSMIDLECAAADVDKTMNENRIDALENMMRVLVALEDGEAAPSSSVDSPQHYGGRECIDSMRTAFGDAAIKDFAICNAMKYLWRHQKKGGREDIEKAIWYLKYWLEVENSEKENA